MSLDYSLAPESPFPSAANDVLQLYRRSLTGGLLPRQIAISGDSTGDGLALETLINIREEGLPRPVCAMLISPWTDLTVSGHSIKTLAAVDPILKKEALTEFSAMYLNGALTTILLESPLYASLHQLPSILIQVGAAEILLDDTLRLQSKLAAASNNVEVQV